MAAVLDHVHMGCSNVYTTAFDLMQATRIGHCDAGFVDTITTGQKVMPLGGSVYMEIESIIDPFATSDTLSFRANRSLNGDEFRAVFTNGFGPVYSSAATLTVYRQIGG